MRRTPRRPTGQWPDPAGQQAFYGLAGEMILALAPSTEAAPVAMLLQLLASVGHCLGRTAHFIADGSVHFLLLFAVIVGATSKSRKGTSWSQVKRQLDVVDPGWSLRASSGLSSGEGLIWRVRDPTEDDPGVADKRLLVIEPEFAGPLRTMRRDGNVLGTTIRQAWDGEPLRVLTKNFPTEATGAHITIVGHVTVEELRLELSTTDIANGFGNRFLWGCADRSNVLPDGADVDPAVMEPLHGRLRRAIDMGQTFEEMRRDESVKSLWHAVYPVLSEGRPGLAGSMTARAEAQVMRLACLYAVLDESPWVFEPHLRAALALWKYAEASVHYIFGDALGDPIADELLGALREAPDGLSRTDIRDHFNRHASQHDLDRALALLARLALARVEETGTGGRPEERWFAIGAAAAPSGGQAGN